MIMFVLCAATASFSSAPPSVLLRCSSASALTGKTHLEIAQGLLERTDVMDAVIECEFTDNAPVMVPLCWSTAEWSAKELDELQWPPLVAAASRRSAEMRALAKQHARPEFKAFGRFKGAQALLTALELAHCHTMAVGDGGELWLVPARAAYPRSAPSGASLQVCPESGDLIFVGSMVDASPARAPPAPPNPLLNLFFLGDDDDEEENAPGFSVSSGAKTNDELLLTEGWADENLSSDAFELPLDVLAAASARVIGEEDAGREDTSWPEMRAQIVDGLRQAGRLPADGYGKVVRARGGASEALIASARALSLGGRGVDALGGVSRCIEQICSAYDEGDAALPSEYEARAWRLLALASEDLLSSFPTTAEEDAELLEALLIEDSGQLADHRRVQCVRSRLSRKRCLAELL